MEGLISCHTFLYDKKLAELGVDASDEKVRCTFLKSEVELIREVIEKSGDSEVSKDKCCVEFKSGNSMWIDMPYEEAVDAIIGVHS